MYQSGEKLVNKPVSGHFAKAGVEAGEGLWELRLPQDAGEELEAGAELKVDMFAAGERVDVTGTSKGKGFAGTIKRWGFSRGPSTHGCKNVREPGSTGMATFPGRVLKGKRMPGQKGNKRITTMNLKIVDIRPEQNLMLVKGAIPGSSNGIVFIRKTNRGK